MSRNTRKPARRLTYAQRRRAHQARLAASSICCTALSTAALFVGALAADSGAVAYAAGSWAACAVFGALALILICIASEA